MPKATPQQQPITRRKFFATRITNVPPELDLSTFRAKLRTDPKSPYMEALRGLANAKRGSVLEVESAKAYPSFVKAAKRLGYECHYAELNGKLYIQIVDTGRDK